MSKLTFPTDIQGQPKFLWKTGETTYTKSRRGKSNEQVDGWNKQLLTYFKGHFPEYSDVFAGLVARATERGSGRGYGTVEELSPSK